MQQAEVLQEHRKTTHVVDYRRGLTRVKAAPQQVRMGHGWTISTDAPDANSW